LTRSYKADKLINYGDLSTSVILSSWELASSIAI